MMHPLVIRAFSEGRFWDILRQVYGQAMSLNFFVGGVCSLILMAIYINSRSVVLTATTAMLSGAVVVEWFPPEVRIAGFLLIFAGVAAAGSSIYLGRRRRITT